MAGMKTDMTLNKAGGSRITGLSSAGKMRGRSALPAAFVFLFVILFLLLVPSAPAAAQTPRGEKSVRRLVIDLDHEYRRLDREIRKLDELVRGFPGMILHLSVSKQGPGPRLVSLELTDKRSPLHGHIYTPIENEAMDAGGRHQFYRGEVSEGVHELKAVYYWAEDKGPPRRGETVVILTVKPNKSYFVELSLEKPRGGKAELRPHEFEFVGP